MGKGMDGGGLGLSGDFRGVFPLQPQHLMYGATKKAACRSPAGGIPHFGVLGYLHGAPSASPARVEVKGPAALGCWPGATGSHKDRVQPLCSLSAVSERPFRDPISHKTRHKQDYSWCLTDPSSAPTAHRNSHLPACVSSFFIYFPLHLNKQDARKQGDKVQPTLLLPSGRLCLAPLPPAPPAVGEVF